MAINRQYRSSVNKSLVKLGIEKEVREFILAGIKNIVKCNIDPLDLNLRQDFYPSVEAMCGLSYKGIEKRIRQAISESYKSEQYSSFYSELGYHKRPTVKKLILLLLYEIVLI